MVCRSPCNTRLTFTVYSGFIQFRNNKIFIRELRLLWQSSVLARLYLRATKGWSVSVKFPNVWMSVEVLTCFFCQRRRNKMRIPSFMLFSTDKAETFGSFTTIDRECSLEIQYYNN